MADLDLAAIRALVASWRRWENVAKRPSPYAEDLADACDALLAVAEDHARLVPEHRQLADRLREAEARAERLRVSRNAWRMKALEAVSVQRFVIGGDCPVVGCRGERVELMAVDAAEPVAVLLDCGHAPATDAEPSPSPAVPAACPSPAPDPGSEGPD